MLQRTAAAAASVITAASLLLCPLSANADVIQVWIGARSAWTAMRTPRPPPRPPRARMPTPPSWPRLQTVPASQITNYAAPLPKSDKLDKGKVWIVVIGGAAALFATTLLAENNEAWFPAISKANRAMAKSREMAQKVRVRAAWLAASLRAACTHQQLCAQRMHACVPFAPGRPLSPNACLHGT